MNGPTSPTESRRDPIRLRFAGVLVCCTLAATVYAPSARAAPAATSRSAKQEAVVVSKQALAYYLGRRYVVAADMYRRASRLDPTEAAYSYAAARAYHKAGRFSEALLLYEEAIKVGGRETPYRVKAEHHMAAARAKQGADREFLKALAAKPVRADAPSRPGKPTSSTGEAAGGAADKPPSGKGSASGAGAKVSGSSPAADPLLRQKRAPPSRVVGWSVIAAGGASLVAGIVVGYRGWSDQASLRDDLAKTRSYRVNGETRSLIDMSKSSAETREASANNRVILGWTLGGVGVAGLTVGVWQLTRSTASSVAQTASPWTISPWVTGRGMVTTWRF